MTIMEEMEEWISRDAATRSVWIAMLHSRVRVICRLDFGSRRSIEGFRFVDGEGLDTASAIKNAMENAKERVAETVEQNKPVEAGGRSNLDEVPKRSTLDRSNWDPWQTLKMRDFPFAGSTDK